jgi:hypothetical protein
LSVGDELRQERRRALGEELTPDRGQPQIVDNPAIDQPHIFRLPE